MGFLIGSWNLSQIEHGMNLKSQLSTIPTLFRWFDFELVLLFIQKTFLSLQKPRFHSRLIASRTPPGRRDFLAQIKMEWWIVSHGGSGQRNSIDFDQNLGKCYSWTHPEAEWGKTVLDFGGCDKSLSQRVLDVICFHDVLFIEPFRKKQTFVGKKKRVLACRVHAVPTLASNPADPWRASQLLFWLTVSSSVL